MLFNVINGKAHKVPLTKLVLMDLRPYFFALLVAVLYKVGYSIRVQKKGNIIELTEKEFENFLANEGAKTYNNYDTLVWDYHLYILP